MAGYGNMQSVAQRFFAGGTSSGPWLYADTKTGYRSTKKEYDSVMPRQGNNSRSESVDIYIVVARKIREFRAAYRGVGISQGDLAKLLGVPQNKVSRWETCTYKPTLADIESLSRVFGVPFGAIVGDDSQGATTQEIQSIMQNLTVEDLREVAEYALFRSMRRKVE